jgi:hypothetical protein
MNNNQTLGADEHVAPRTPAEELIAKIYSSILNEAPLGVFDELDTMTLPQAMWMRQCLQQIFHVDIPADQSLQFTSVGALVDFLSEVWGGREIVEEIAWTFSQVDMLSDEEVKSQLAEEFSIYSLRSDDTT